MASLDAQTPHSDLRLQLLVSVVQTPLPLQGHQSLASALLLPRVTSPVTRLHWQRPYFQIWSRRIWTHLFGKHDSTHSSLSIEDQSDIPDLRVRLPRGHCWLFSGAEPASRVASSHRGHTAHLSQQGPQGSAGETGCSLPVLIHHLLGSPQSWKWS